MPRSDDSEDDSSPAPDSEATGRLTPDELDALCACLADHHRRVLIDRLSETSGQMVVDELVEHLSERETGETSRTPSNVSPAELTITLLHNHLPKLDEAGVVEVDDETKTVREGDRFDVATSFLEVV